MNARLHALVVALLAVSLSLAACSRSDTANQRTAAQSPDPKTASNSQPTPPAVPPATSDTSSSGTPAAAPQAQQSAQDATSGQTANANDRPMSSMDKDQETKAMPQPGQANDHSTLAQDPKQPK